MDKYFQKPIYGEIFLGEEIPIFGFGNWFLDLFNNSIFLKYPKKGEDIHTIIMSFHPSIHCRLTASLLSNTYAAGPSA